MLYKCLALSITLGILSGCGGDNDKNESPSGNTFSGSLAVNINSDTDSMVTGSSEGWFTHKIDLEDTMYGVSIFSEDLNMSGTEITFDIANYTTNFTIEGVGALDIYDYSYWERFSKKEILEKNPLSRSYTVNSHIKTHSDILSGLGVSHYVVKPVNKSVGLITWQLADDEASQRMELTNVTMNLTQCDNISFDPVSIDLVDFDGDPEVKGSGYGYFHLSEFFDSENPWASLESLGCKLDISYTINGIEMNESLLDTFNPGEWVNITFMSNTAMGSTGISYVVANGWPDSSDDHDIDVDILDDHIPLEFAQYLIDNKGYTIPEINKICKEYSSGINVQCEMKNNDAHIEYVYTETRTYSYKNHPSETTEPRLIGTTNDIFSFSFNDGGQYSSVLSVRADSGSTLNSFENLLSSDHLKSNLAAFDDTNSVLNATVTDTNISLSSDSFYVKLNNIDDYSNFSKVALYNGEDTYINSRSVTGPGGRTVGAAKISNPTGEKLLPSINDSLGVLYSKYSE